MPANLSPEYKKAEQVLAVCAELAKRNITLSDRWPGLSAERNAGLPVDARARDAEEVPNPFQVQLPTLLVANKSDLDSGPYDSHCATGTPHADVAQTSKP